MAVIDVDNLTKDYGSGRGVYNVSFHIDKGECYGYLGPNGAGKSTTIRHLMGFSRPDSGSCRILGYDCFSSYFKSLKQVGYIPGEISLPTGLNGKEFLKMISEMEGVKNGGREQELLSTFELDEASLSIPSKRLSLGIKRKLAIVAAFISDPSVLILDEPTSGLDPLMQEKFIKLILNERSRGKTILLSSHIFGEVDATCDKIGIIKDGKLVSEFEADSLRHNDRKTYRIHFSSQESYKIFCIENPKPGFCSILEKHDYSSVVILSCLDEKVNDLISLLSSYDIASFSSSKESLQEYFMKFYKEDIDYGAKL